MTELISVRCHECFILFGLEGQIVNHRTSQFLSSKTDPKVEIARLEFELKEVKSSLEKEQKLRKELELELELWRPRKEA